MNVVYPVLEGKIAERGIRKSVIAKTAKIGTSAFWNKMNGLSEFTFPEALTIQKNFFPDIGLEELYKKG